MISFYVPLIFISVFGYAWYIWSIMYADYVIQFDWYVLMMVIMNCLL